MTNRTRAGRRSFLLLLGPALWLAGCQSAVMQPWFTAQRPALQAPVAIPANGLVLDLVPSRQTFELGEPVFLKLIATNRSGQPMRVFPRLSPEAGVTRLEVSPPDDARVFNFLPLTLVNTAPPIRILDQDESIEVEFPCFFGGNGWTFDEPGLWHVRLVYDWGSGAMRREATSGFVPIEVGTMAQTAGEYLIQDTEKSWQAGKFMTWMTGDHLDRGVLHLDQLRMAHGTSAIATYARFYLGHYWSWYGGSPLRSPNPPKGLGYLDALQDSHLPELLQIWKGIDQGRCHLLEGRKVDADAALNAARLIANGKLVYVDLLAEIDRLLAITP